MSEADLQEILARRYSARSFWLIVCLLLIVLGMTTYWFLPWLGTKAISGHPINPVSTALTKIGEELFSAVIVTVGIATMIFRLVPPADRTGKVEAISSAQIGELYDSALRKTSFWQFKGGSGTYLRAKTLPVMDSYAKQQKVNREIYIEVINPFSQEACDQYAAYRRTFASELSKDREAWTAERVRYEVYATVVTASILNGGALTIRLGLSNTWSSFRFDTCSEYVLITNEDPSAPALRADKDTSFYRFFRKELQISLDQSQVVVLAKTNASTETLTAPQMLKILAASLQPWFLPESLDQDGQAAVLKKVKRPINYYAK